MSCTQDTADGEFSVVKTALNQHLLRSDSSAISYAEVTTSKEIVDFGKMYLSTPRARAGLKERIFMDLSPDTVLRRKEEDSKDPADSKTIQGISSKFEIICQVTTV